MTTAHFWKELLRIILKSDAIYIEDILKNTPRRVILLFTYISFQV